MKKLIAVILLFVMILSLAACGGDKKDNGTDLVKVGDAVINDNQLNQYLELTAYLRGIDLTKLSDENLKSVKFQVLDDLTALECIRQYYAGKEDKILPDTIKTDFKDFMDKAKGTDTVKSFLEEKKISDETLERFYYDQYYSKALVDETQAGMKNLDNDAKAYYEANKESFKVDEVTASHILVKDEAAAKEIQEKLKAGEKFEDLAKQYSIDGSASNGGSLGTFGRGEMVKEFEDAAFALQPGEVSGIVKTEFGYHIIKVTDKNQGTKTYEETKDSIISNLVTQETLKKIEELKKGTKIEYLTDEYKAESK